MFWKGREKIKQRKISKDKEGKLDAKEIWCLGLILAVLIIKEKLKGRRY